MEDNQLNTNSVTTSTASPAAPAPEQDISKATITILVLLTLMISVIGTWTVLNEVSNYRPPSSPSAANAQVSLNVVGPNQNPESLTTGNAVLEIK